MANTETPMIPLTHCPLCRWPIVYEKSLTGLMWFHDVGTDEGEFLCPDGSPPRSDGE